jgi:hypothetical protein
VRIAASHLLAATRVPDGSPISCHANTWAVLVADQIPEVRGSRRLGRIELLTRCDSESRGPRTGFPSPPAPEGIASLPLQLTSVALPEMPTLT